ncbi:MAG: hypothetical protein R3247_06935 [Rhodothermales bacterium]|nr:hypothetical protein [Rhodothermales bacterium]
MPCLVAVVALLFPRLVIAGLWLLTDWFVGVFDGLIIPVLGFLFLPTTLLWYSVVVNVWGGEWDLVQIVGAVIAVLIDLSPASGRRK